ncbi:hypothetical protein CHUAL_007541 [Chamberlinius hualienensis]
MDGTSTRTAENCYDNSSFVSKLTLYWAGKLLLERNTNVDVLTEVPEKLRMNKLYLQYTNSLRKDKERSRNLSQILLHMVKWKCLILSLVMLLEANLFWYHNTSSVSREVLGAQLKITVTAIVYNKLLKIITPDMKKANVGHMINIFANDISKFEEIGKFVCGRLFDPIAILGCLLYLQLTVGLAGTIGIITTIILILFSLCLLTALKRKRAKLADQRLKLTAKMISEIKIMKLLCLEDTYIQSISYIRRKELNLCYVINLCKIVFNLLSVWTSPVAILTTIFVTIYMDNKLFQSQFYACFTLFNILQTNVTILFGRFLENISYLLVAIERIQTILFLHEYSQSNSVKTTPVGTIALTNVISSWQRDYKPLEMSQFHIKVANLTLIKPSINMIIGPVGSGKSSLLLSILNEIYISSGTVKLNGRMTYLPQEPWLYPATIRQNITFGLPFDQQRYQSIVYNCALQQDLEILTEGDMTLVDDKGLTLSGGQMSRIALARTMYRESEIYLLDDPLSAVDVKVGKHIWRHCFKDTDKTIVLVSHWIQHLRDISIVIYMDKGNVSVTKINEIDVSNATQQSEDIVDNRFTDLPCKMNSPIVKNNSSSSQKRNENALLLYCKMVSPCCQGFLILILSFLMIGICPVLSTMFNIYLSIWFYVTYTPHLNVTDFRINQWTMTLPQLTYLNAGISVLFILTYVAFFWLTYVASRRMHNSMLKSIMNTSLLYFDTKNAGNIINRFSKDLALADDVLPNAIYIGAYNGCLQVGIFAMAIDGNYTVAVPVVASVVILWYLTKLYIEGTGCVKNMEASARSPIYTYMDCTVRGVAVIRTHNNEEIVQKEFESKQNYHSSLMFILLGMSNWLALALHVTSAIVPCFMIILCLIWPQYTSSALVGVGLSATFLTPLKVSVVAKFFADATQMILSIKRIQEYIDLPAEDCYLENSQPVRTDWPNVGSIVFKNLTLIYNSANKVALKGINFEIKPGEKIGVVGRTGAGKSSLVTALFRLTKTQGSILIDNVDISTLPLNEYRRKISIIPQNPVSLIGSIRHNLDPSNEFNDDQLWQVLANVQMKDVIKCLDEGMEQMSVGQKQLFCVARTLLKDNRIIILDEATSNVDNKTDQIINNLIKTKFTNSTMLVIAHRLQTVIDLDRIMVIEKGEIVEFDEPRVLLSRSEGIFKSMFDRAHKRNLC